MGSFRDSGYLPFAKSAKKSGWKMSGSNGTSVFPERMFPESTNFRDSEYFHLPKVPKNPVGKCSGATEHLFFRKECSR